MNSAENTQKEIVNGESPSTSQITADRNANPNGDRSKGAIPKVKLVTKSPAPVSKKTVKLNNNIEDMPTLNGVASSSDILKRNGYLKCISSSSNSLNNSGSHVESNGDKMCPKEDCEEPLVEYNFSNRMNIPVENQRMKISYELYPGALLLKNYTKNEVDSSGFKEKKNSFNQADVTYFRDSVWQHLRPDSDSSSDDNELLSVSDDGCIYTYKADHVADLPSSFFNLVLPPLENNEPVDENREGNSSPEMDFLEMDFDPGPSGDADSDSVFNADMETRTNFPCDIKETNIVESKPCCSKDLNKLEPPVESNTNNTFNTTVQNNYEQFSKIIKQVCVKSTCVVPVRSEVKMPWSCTLTDRTQCEGQWRSIRRHHSSKGELVSPSECPVSSPSVETNNLSAFDDEKRMHLVETIRYFRDNREIEDVMVWTVDDANLKQITQIAPSSCGATAVLNVLTALRLPLPSSDKIQELVNTRFRENGAALPRYLVSRSNAGSNHRDIIAGLYKASEGRVYSRFFSMYPERIVNLYQWLGYWINQGAVPIATINLQKCHGKIPDSWHHQMIFGVGYNRVHLTNPMECLEPCKLWAQLCSESVLLIRKEDVVSRWNPKSDLSELIKINDVRWREMNVVGQVAKIIRESKREIRLGSTVTSYVKIPAEYRSGITLAIDIQSPAFSLLRQCPELPLLHPSDAANAFNVQHNE